MVLTAVVGVAVGVQPAIWFGVSRGNEMLH